MKAYITKYALTLGVQEIEGEISKTCSSMFTVPHISWNRNFHREGRDWHRTREAAVKRAEMMRLNKIASLKKSIVKLKSLEFK